MKLEQDHYDWEPCKPGVLQEAALSAPPRNGLVRGLILSTVVAVVFATCYFTIFESEQAQQATLPGGISCELVNARLTCYVNGRISDRQLTKAISFHLMRCNACQKNYDSICCNKHRCGNRPTAVTLKPKSQGEAPAPSPSPLPAPSPSPTP